jgi:hypothetical protein
MSQEGTGAPFGLHRCISGFSMLQVIATMPQARANTERHKAFTHSCYHPQFRNAIVDNSLLVAAMPQAKVIVNTPLLIITTMSRARACLETMYTNTLNTRLYNNLHEYAKIGVHDM